MNKIKMNVQGRVQGVGFRYMTKIVADQLGITGTVKNEDDGSVTIEAAGDNQKIRGRSQTITKPQRTCPICRPSGKSDDGGQKKVCCNRLTF